MDQLLPKFTLLAKDVIYNAERMKKFLQMMSTPDGAIIAVRTVMGAIEQAKPIPPEIAKQLAVNVYLLLVDMAQEVTNKEASPAVMKSVIGKLLQGVAQSHGQQAQPQQQPVQQPAQQPQGLIQGAMA